MSADRLVLYTVNPATGLATALTRSAGNEKDEASTRTQSGENLTKSSPYAWVTDLIVILWIYAVFLPAY